MTFSFQPHEPARRVTTTPQRTAVPAAPALPKKVYERLLAALWFFSRRGPRQKEKKLYYFNVYFGLLPQHPSPLELYCAMPFVEEEAAKDPRISQNMQIDSATRRVMLRGKRAQNPKQCFMVKL